MSLALNGFTSEVQDLSVRDKYLKITVAAGTDSHYVFERDTFLNHLLAMVVKNKIEAVDTTCVCVCVCVCVHASACLHVCVRNTYLC